MAEQEQAGASRSQLAPGSCRRCPLDRATWVYPGAAPRGDAKCVAMTSHPFFNRPRLELFQSGLWPKRRRKNGIGLIATVREVTEFRGHAFADACAHGRVDLSLKLLQWLAAIANSPSKTGAHPGRQFVACQAFRPRNTIITSYHAALQQQTSSREYEALQRKRLRMGWTENAEIVAGTAAMSCLLSGWSQRDVIPPLNSPPV